MYWALHLLFGWTCIYRFIHYWNLGVPQAYGEIAFFVVLVCSFCRVLLAKKVLSAFGFFFLIVHIRTTGFGILSFADSIVWLMLIYFSASTRWDSLYSKWGWFRKILWDKKVA